MIVIRPFTEEWREPVREFNRRLNSSEFVFPDQAGPERFLAVEDGAVRGAYMARPQRFLISGREVEVAHYRLPVSEGMVNRGYAGVGGQMLRYACRQYPLLYALGMGGFDRPLPKMLAAAGWSLHAAAFYVKALRPFRVFRNIRRRRGLMNLAAFTGIGWLGVRVFERRIRNAVEVEVAPAFGEWADAVWEESGRQYGCVARRDAQTLNELYPPQSRFHRVKVGRAGWAVALDTNMTGDRYFGNLRLGSIVDCLAPPREAGLVIRAATKFLEDRGVDLIVSNQLHAAWSKALADAGFWRGPSNFIFAASRKLAELARDPAEIHINRGDGDGPIHL